MSTNEFYQSILAGVFAGLIVGISSIIISSCVYSDELCTIRNVMSQTIILIFFTIGLFLLMFVVAFFLSKLEKKLEIKWKK